MAVQIKVDLVPFELPTNVRIRPLPGLRQEGFKPGDQIPLTALDSDVLHALCEQFVRGVYAIAEKEALLPPQCKVLLVSGKDNESV